METNKFNQDYVDGLSGPKAWFSKFCNTFGIVEGALGAGNASGYWDGQPSYRAKFADQAIAGASTYVGCTTAFSTGFGVRTVRAMIWLKSYVMGVATGTNPGFIFQLQVATGVAAFGVNQAATGTSIIDVRQIARATSTVILNGFTPDNLPYAAARVAVFPIGAQSITDAASFDCCIDATPGS